MSTASDSLILSRIPHKVWFGLDEAAYYSGWGRTFLRDRIKEGTLPAQQFQRPDDIRYGSGRPHMSYRIHRDDLVLFIGRAFTRTSELRVAREMAEIVRRWPGHMREELADLIANPLKPIPTSP